MFPSLSMMTPSFRQKSKKLFLVLGHAQHEKSLQRQKGVVSLVGSEEEKANIVPMINR